MRKAILAGLLLIPAAVAQTPRLTNAKVETKAAASLDAEFRGALARNTPLWFGYAVEKAGDGESCCSWNGVMGGCSLEGEVRRDSASGAASGPVQLEGSKFISVLYRMDGGAVTKVRHFSSNCDLDAGGLPVVWLTGVNTTQSLQLLKRHASEKLANGAIAAIATHAGAEADAILEEFVKPDQPVETRRKAVFWMGTQRGRIGVETLKRVARDDSSDKVREHAVFVLARSKDPEGLQTVLRIAKEDRSAHVRSQALFWIAQMAGQKAIGPISSAIEDDPDTKVKRQAVFALTQMPDDEGVPALIKVARENRNPAVRKQAFFWLGRSKDPRAARFLEEVLVK